MSAIYRVGIIGHTGRGNYGHGLDVVWKGIPRVEVAAVADEHETGRAAARERTGAKTAYADYREMLATEKLNVVAVCPRWIDQHHAMLLACAEHGCHVYMEKPFCRTLEEADEIVRAFEMRHLKLAIAHTNRYTPQLAIARKLIAAGEIGTLLELRARGKEDVRGGGEDLWVLGTHMLDLMRAVAGDPTSCFARLAEGGQPVGREHVREGNEGLGPLAGDAVHAMYAFPEGVYGHFASRRHEAGSPTRFGLRVYGSKGVLEFQSGYLKTAWILKDSSWSPAQSGSRWVPISSNGVGRPETQSDATGGNAAAVKDLLEAIENDRQPKSSLYDARAATEMIAAVFESHRQGGPVSLPLATRQNPLTLL
ncbi:MAG TPA: Gfo/Idh/MocA family oxidoreductase [Planctomycetaceae bacterium]|nr:Gfo/Idh/MocA family oxidoreductase [Planctomycetaceae bacterium]